MENPPLAPTSISTTLDHIRAIPKEATFATIKTVFRAILQENRNPGYMEQAFNALPQAPAVLLLQNLFPNEQQAITRHPTTAYSIFRQKFSTTQNNVDYFFTLLESTQETVHPAPPQSKNHKNSQQLPQNPPPKGRLAQALRFLGLRRS